MAKSNRSQLPYQRLENLEQKFQKRISRPIKRYEEDIDIVILYLDRIEELLEQILEQRIDLLRGENMDKKIKSAKKSIDNKMDHLIKEDKKRDKKCEHDEKLARKRN